MGDFGILATGLHEITVGLTGHLWHCLTPLLCFNTSTEQGTVNVGSSVMIRFGLHLTPSGVAGRVAGGRNQKRKNLLSGRHATEPYGGKTGGAMIKYPHTKKNAQARFNPYYQISKYISVCTITSSP